MDIMINYIEVFVMVVEIDIEEVFGMFVMMGRRCGRFGELWGIVGVVLRVFFGGLLRFVLGCLGSSFFLLFFMLLLLCVMLIRLNLYPFIVYKRTGSKHWLEIALIVEMNVYKTGIKNQNFSLNLLETYFKLLYTLPAGVPITRLQIASLAHLILLKLPIKWIVLSAKIILVFVAFYIACFVFPF